MTLFHVSKNYISICIYFCILKANFLVIDKTSVSIKLIEVTFLVTIGGHRGRDCMVNLQLSVQSVPITTKVASSNPIHGKV